MNIPDELKERIKTAKNVAVFTGAGISAESGIPTFRGKDGIWNKFRPEELANFDAFIKNPELVWEWYNHRRKIISETKPNNGHFAIKELENIFDDVRVITQNVDNLHKRAGSKAIYELHGNIEKNFCIKCKKRFDFIELIESDKLLKCDCGGLIRPGVVWFGEMLPEKVFAEAENFARKTDLFFIVGTSAVVYPAALMPIYAKESGSYLIEINIEATEITYSVHHSFFGQSGEVLPELLEKIKLILTGE